MDGKGGIGGMFSPLGKSTRKQWTLHDGPRGSLQRLRNQLAKDGCPESQVVLAKQLLEERCELDVDKTENARLAVYWLIKSSEQGNEEATHLLEKCLQKGQGINEHNYLDVKSCINMTQDEKLARKAAREMFASLSNGEDFITSDQLQKRMIEIYHQTDQNIKVESVNGHAMDEDMSNGRLVNNEEPIPEEIDWANRFETKNEKLTEENLVSAAVNYAHGELPVVNRVLCLTEPNPNALDHVPYFHRSILHPVLTFRILYYKLIRILGNLPYFTFLPVARSNIQLLVLLLIYALFGTENVALFVPMSLYYLSFLTMIVTTFQILQSKHDYQDFRVWSGLFLLYSGGSLNAEEAEFQFVRNNLKPYGRFFLALLINLIVYPAVSTQWIPQSEFTIVAFFLTFITLMMFIRSNKTSKSPNLVLLLSFGFNVLARYPYDADAVVTQGWRFLDLRAPSFTSYVIGNGIEFCLNFRILFFIAIAACFANVATKDKGRGIYKYLIPHCVTLSWLQIIVISSRGATMYGLLRGTLALVGFVLFLPLAGLASLLIPIVAVANFVYESDYFMTLVFASIFGLAFICSSWILSMTKYNKYITTIQILMGIFALTFLLFTSTRQPISVSLRNSMFNFETEKNVQPQKMPTLTSKQYENYCHQTSWDETNTASTELKCSHLDGASVHWDGFVSNVKINRIENRLKSLLDHFPNIIRQHLYCAYGEEYENDCATFKTYDECQLFMNLAQKCHMNNWNSYEFEITIKFYTGVWSKDFEIALIAENEFKNFTQRLKVNDKVWFRGILTNEFNEESSGRGLLGGPRTKIKLLEIGCIACHNDIIEHRVDLTKATKLKNILTNLYVGLKFVCNFLLNPIVTFK